MSFDFLIFSRIIPGFRTYMQYNVQQSGFARFSERIPKKLSIEVKSLLVQYYPTLPLPIKQEIKKELVPFLFRLLVP